MGIIRRLGVALALALLVGCTARTADQTAPSIVRIGWADVGVPTPFRVSTAGPGGAAMISLIYDTLTWKDEQGIIPWLATSWDNKASSPRWPRPGTSRPMARTSRSPSPMTSTGRTASR